MCTPTPAKSICVFAASSGQVPPKFHSAARRLGTLIGGRGHTLIYGAGGVGLMGVMARAAKEAGARVIGVIPEKLCDSELAWEGADELVVTTSMRERKGEMESRADAFMVFPGGFGTLDEAAECLVMRQLEYHQKPIVFVNIEGFFDPLFAYFETLFGLGFAKERHRGLYAIAGTVEDAIACVESFEAPAPDPKWHTMGEG